MTEFVPMAGFEQQLRLALATPEPRPNFERALRARLSERAAEPTPSHRPFRLRLAWGILIGVFLLLTLTVLVIGPQRVAAEVRKLLGYIPGFGIVEQNASLRVLAEPVSQTRDGITVTVEQVFLTSERATVKYSVVGVPWSAFPHNENVSGCTEGAQLQLPDGTRLTLTGGGGTLMELTFDYPPVPAGIDQAIFILPCLQGTLPGLAPENWELSLHFVPAPANLTIMPAIDIMPLPEPQASQPVVASNPLVLLKVVDTGDNYVLLGEFRRADAGDPSVPDGFWWSLTEPVHITDAAGQEVFYTIPDDPSLQLPPSGPGAEPWAYQIGKTFAPPLTITYAGQYTVPADPNATAEFEFDAGADPQPGQEWVLNRDVELAGHTITLVSIQVVSQSGQSGYQFTLETTDPAVRDVGVDISGYLAQGGGGNAGLRPGKWEKSLAYADLPTGKLTVVLSNLTLYGKFRTWQLQWSPETAQPGSPSLYGIRLTIDRYIPLEDGYYLVGHTNWTDKRIAGASLSGGVLKAYDSGGQELTLEPADWDKVGLTPEPGQWLYRLYGKSFNGPLTLRATQMNVEFAQPVGMTLDLRSYGFDGLDAQLGLTWKTGLIPLDVPGLPANAFKVTYVKSGELRGFEIGLSADPALQGLPLTIVSGLDTAGMNAVNSASSSSLDETAGQLVSTVLTDARITFPLVLSASSATVGGTWEVTWNLPSAEPGANP